jgi:hypothetical protein
VLAVPFGVDFTSVQPAPDGAEAVMLLLLPSAISRIASPGLTAAGILTVALLTLPLNEPLPTKAIAPVAAVDCGRGSGTALAPCPGTGATPKCR